MEETLCRFCLGPKENKKNPFIRPCLCTGSVAHVHKRCFDRWRFVTTSDEHKRRCQLCLSEYTTVRKWPSETIPEIEIRGAWTLLSLPFLCNSIVFGIHYAICIEYLLMPIKRIQGQQDVIVQEVVQPHGTYCFLILLALLTSMYVAFYWKYVASTKNKLRYIAYWLRNDIARHTDITPLMYIVYLSLSLVAIWYGTFLFGIIYIYLLPKYMEVHKGILHAINDDGEIE